MRLTTTYLVTLLIAASSPLGAMTPDAEPTEIPQVRRFLGDQGFGEAHAEAPEQLHQFGRLIGIWDATQQVRTQDGSWVDGAPALWIWKYTLDGFATQDLWLHTEENLPSYLGALGRPYLLTELRIFEVASGRWRIAWAANGGGKSPGADFGTFDAEYRDGDMVMTGESPYGRQRVIFYEITDSSFRWSSEYSQDGETWMELMRVEARRRPGAR